MLIPISELKFKKMPIVNGIYPNRFDDSDDFEDFCGMEHFPYILLREDVTEEPSNISQSQTVPEKPSIFYRIIDYILIKKWNFRKYILLF